MLIRRNTFVKVSLFIIVGILSLFTIFNYRFANPSYSPDLAYIIKIADSNRSQLKSVLSHYSKTPSDSLKLRAAEFLISNMPGKYSRFYDAHWNDVATVCMRWTSSLNKQMVLEQFGLGKPVIQEDLKYITADYLVNNIDLAFKVWQEVPWGKSIDFETFCEEILPYRVDNEPLENWRAKALASFADLYRYFLTKPDMTAKEACDTLNSLLPRFKFDPDFPAMNFSQAMASAHGMCNHQAALGCMVMRALGIPVTREFTPVWMFTNVGHKWNTVNNGHGRHIPFMATEVSLFFIHRPAKVYRETFAFQSDNPTLFGSACFRDVSSEYTDMCELQLPARFAAHDKMDTVYLAIPGKTGQAWHIVGNGSLENGKYNFHAAGAGLLYCAFEDAEMQQLVDAPFILKENGEIYFLKPDTSLMQTIGLSFSTTAMEHMLQGRFEGANHSDFSDAVVLHTIVERPAPLWNTIRLPAASRFRYLRYCSPTLGYAHIAELLFFNAEGQHLRGKTIAKPTSFKVTRYPAANAFDGDPLTFVHSDPLTMADIEADPASHPWIGLDLGQKQGIVEIRFIPRNEGCWKTGDKYELFYGNGLNWQRLANYTVASDLQIHARVPANAVFYFHNSATGVDSKVFWIDDGKQRFIERGMTFD